MNQSLTIGETTVSMVYTDGADVMGFYGSVDLEVVGFVTISGAFGFEKQVDGTTTKLLIGASGVNVFLGTGAGTPDALGLQISGVDIGVVFIKVGAADAGFALAASGAAELVGLDGLQISGTLGIRLIKPGWLSMKL